MTNAAGFFSTAVSEMRRCDRSAARRHPATSGPRPAPTTKMVLRDGEPSSQPGHKEREHADGESRRRT